jgi:hypothetical protein
MSQSFLCIFLCIVGINCSFQVRAAFAEDSSATATAVAMEVAKNVKVDVKGDLNKHSTK